MTPDEQNRHEIEDMRSPAFGCLEHEMQLLRGASMDGSRRTARGAF